MEPFQKKKLKTKHMCLCVNVHSNLIIFTLICDGFGVEN